MALPLPPIQDIVLSCTHDRSHSGDNICRGVQERKQSPYARECDATPSLGTSSSLSWVLSCPCIRKRNPIPVAFTRCKEATLPDGQRLFLAIIDRLARSGGNHIVEAETFLTYSACNGRSPRPKFFRLDWLRLCFEKKAAERILRDGSCSMCKTWPAYEKLILAG